MTWLRASALCLASVLCACGEDSGRTRDPIRSGTSTGNALNTQLMHHTGAEELDPVAARDLVIVGLPDSKRGPANVLTIEHIRTQTDYQALLGDVGDFTGLVDGVLLGDQLRLTLSGAGDEVSVMVTITDALDQVSPPSIPRVILPFDLLSVSAPGQVTVDFRALAGIYLPYVVYNQDSGAVVLAFAGVSVEIAGVAGDVICLFALDDVTDDASVHHCDIVP